MANLSLNPRQPEPRISQILPTVKCSSCNQPVPLDQLGDHVCSPPTPSAASAAPAPAPAPTPRLHPNPPPGPAKHVPPPLRLQTALPPMSPGPGSSRTPLDPRSARTPPTHPQDPRMHGSPGPRAGPGPIPPRSAPSPAPSRASARSPAPLQSMASPSRTRNPGPPPRQPLPRSPEPIINAPPSAPFRPPPAELRPSLGPGGGDPQSAARFRAHSNLSTPPMLDAHPPPQRRPSAPPSPFVQAPSGAFPPRAGPSPGPFHPPPRSAPSPAPSTFSSHQLLEEIDTKTGGAAGMAGVGRRGFAAAARAAMFAATPITSHFPPMSPHLPHTPMTPWQSAQSPLPMDSKGIRSPPLDAQNPMAPPQMQYPLATSPSSLSPRSPDPRFSSNAPSLISSTSSATPPPHERESTATVTPSSIPFPVKPADSSKRSEAPGPLTPTSPTGSSLPSFDAFLQKKAAVPELGGSIKVVTQDDMNSSSFLQRGAEDDESEFGGLAYAQSDGSDDDALIARSTGRPPRVRSPSISSSTYSDDPPRAEHAPVDEGLDMAMAALLRSPTSSTIDEPLSPTSPTSLVLPRASKPPMRSLTTPAQRDSATRGSVIGRRGGTISGAIGGGSSEKKERMSQESTASGLAKRRPQIHTCVRCSKDIEDKRWIRVENGRGVLCDKCWKHMYLPKCRRCNLPIEKQAVSSSDGQLKGKYHRDCFNCHTCHKPFPDKSFYVFDGKPFCDYHYHEANDSLCAAPDCGRPIEGPCAVSHSGDRYHPEHLTCEYEDEDTDVRCDERLVDYWEVEGRMLCERHMRRAVEQDLASVGFDDDAGRGTADSSRAMKRKTQFIDIAGLGAAGLR